MRAEIDIDQFQVIDRLSFYDIVVCYIRQVASVLVMLIVNYGIREHFNMGMIRKWSISCKHILHIFMRLVYKVSVVYMLLTCCVLCCYVWSTSWKYSLDYIALLGSHTTCWEINCFDCNVNKFSHGAIQDTDGNVYQGLKIYKQMISTF